MERGIDRAISSQSVASLETSVLEESFASTSTPVSNAADDADFFGDPSAITCGVGATPRCPWLALAPRTEEFDDLVAEEMEVANAVSAEKS